MNSNRLRPGVRALAFGLAIACSLPSAWATEYDLVIVGGRVMDPETGFDQVANVGIRDDRIVRISAEGLLGAPDLEARGL
ncbi:MAG: D-glutamate deacylase, partial [Gammaproteobacteria bacterium]|nr:D-glutamate deacylase [Gammaproteobacteria bacterium]